MHSIANMLKRARAEGHEILPEPDGLALIRTLGVRVPRQIRIEGSAEAAGCDLDAIPGDRTVVKVVSTEILHKTDVGGVAVVPKDRARLTAVLKRMERRFADRHVLGYTLNEFVAYDTSLGGELLLALRWTPDFGPIVAVGAGGIHAEFLADALGGGGIAIVSPQLTPRDRLRSILSSKAVPGLAGRRFRGRAPRIEPDELCALVERLMDFATAAMPQEIAELEINPLALTGEGPVALDALVRLGSRATHEPVPTPLYKLRHLLMPREIAVIGVSTQDNPGHVIVRNTLEASFSPERLYIVKSGVETLEGCRCYPAVRDLPGRVDLIVLAVDARQVPALVDEIVTTRKAESLIVIPGGLGERSGSGELAERIGSTLRAARLEDWQGPVVNGGNCLGVLSRPGRYNTLFIPGNKLPLPPSHDGSPLALISQSGAFIAAKLSALAGVAPRYAVSIGNQLDLTTGDYLTYLQDDPEIAVFACYVEGFRPLDGRRWLAAAERITRSGRTVLLYRAGRTPEGAKASASHTAAIAGDATVTRELAQGVGVTVADSLADFEDLVRLFASLHDKRVSGWRLAGLSNAGFECVAIADNLGRFEPAVLGEPTTRRLRELLGRCGLDGIVDVNNPFDVTPMMGDEGFVESARILLEDPGVDVAVFGCVPMTPALSTLEGEHGLVDRLLRLAGDCDKAWVAVVDGGRPYDALVHTLQDAGVPTFRTVDRALRLLEAFCEARRRI